MVAQRVVEPKSGTAMRSWAISRALAQIGDLAIVDVATDPGRGGEPGTIELHDGGTARYARVAVADLAAWFATHDLDVVVAGETALAPWIRDVADVTRVVDCQNVESDLWREHAARGPAEQRAAHAERARVSGLLERFVLPQLDQVWVVSRADADTLAARAPGSSIDVVPNVVPVSEPVRREPEPGHGVFFGSLWYPPNQEAVTELVAVSDALTRRGHPHRFTVAGVGAPDWLLAEVTRHPAIAAPGFVDDLAGLVGRASCAVFPMTSGGGSMIKLLTALGAGCPVVTTPEGARGIPELVDGVNVVIRPLGDSFVDAVAALLVAPSGHDALGRAGARLIRDGYSVNVLDARVAELLCTDPPPADVAVPTAPAPDGD